ncbi:MAG TPA: sugar phosphate isomerase/epimerase family protein [Verrucomicrobiae bacterium]|jgi:hexulose-6-phosphate isomerase
MKTSRRQFLQSTTTVLTAAAIGAPLFAAEEKPKRQLKKAIMWGTIGYKGTVMEKCRALKAAGFEGVEPNSHMDQDEMVRALEETGLKAASVCGDRHWGRPLSSSDEKVRAEGLEALKQTIRDAKRYGATSILLVPGKVEKEVTFEQCWERSIAGIRQAIPLCEETGVKIAVENVWNNFLMKPEQAKKYLDEINSPWVGWHFDIGNHVRFGPSEEWIKVLGKRILKLHIKDYSTVADAAGKQKGFGVKLLEGSVNWPAVMSELDKIGYTGWAITEQPGAQTKDAESLKEFSATFSKVLAS